MGSIEYKWQQKYLAGTKLISSMPHTILATMAESTTQSNYIWLLSAAIPMSFLAAQKTIRRKKFGFFKRWILKIALRKATEKKNIAAKIIFGLILGLALVALLSLLVGWLWAGVIVAVGLILEFVSKKND